MVTGATVSEEKVYVSLTTGLTLPALSTPMKASVALVEMRTAAA